MSRGAKDAFRAAARPSTVMALAGALTLLTHWSKFADDRVVGVAVVSGLVLVVFLTYFVLALAGFKVSPRGVVEAPRLYAWSFICAIVIVVFGVLFYLLQLRR
jgi:uncharacterized BrkB/YihY/UPF0761 family membrane protein